MRADEDKKLLDDFRDYGILFRKSIGSVKFDGIQHKLMQAVTNNDKFLFLHTILELSMQYHAPVSEILVRVLFQEHTHAEKRKMMMQSFMVGFFLDTFTVVE